MKQNKRHKILLGFAEVAGYQCNLFEGLTSLNQTVGYVNNDNHKYDFKVSDEKNHPVLNNYNRFCKRAIASPTFLNKSLYVLYTIYILFFTVIYYDIFVINKFALFYFLDTKILKFFNKKIIFISLGSDTRPPYLSGVYKDDENYDFNIYKILRQTIKIKNKVNFLEKNVDFFISYPQIAHFNSKPFINGMHIGFPTRPINKSKKAANNKIIKILHAPSRPNSKGTKIIKSIIQELQEEGLKIKLIILKGVSNSEVINQIKQCDIVFDQIYSDMPLAGLGVEAAQFSKPVIVGGYYSLQIHVENNSKNIPPSVYRLPKELKSSLRNLCLDVSKRERVGNSLFEFVNNYWHFEIVAQRYLDLINNTYDNEWVYSPKKIININGWGLSEIELKRNLAKIINTNGGFSNLQISNVVLLNKFKKLFDA